MCVCVGGGGGGSVEYHIYKLAFIRAAPRSAILSECACRRYDTS